MPLKILKLAIDADISVETNPTVTRFFHELDETTTGETTLTIPVEDFWTDTGGDAETFPELEKDNSFINVYINGVLQMDELITYTPGGENTGSLAITVPAGSSILEDSPIVLVITNFIPESASMIVT